MMLESSLLDHELVRDIRHRQDQLWEDLATWLIEALARVSDLGGSIDPRMSQSELHEDLEFGRPS